MQQSCQGRRRPAMLGEALEGGPFPMRELFREVAVCRPEAGADEAKLEVRIVRGGTNESSDVSEI